MPKLIQEMTPRHDLDAVEAFSADLDPGERMHAPRPRASAQQVRIRGPQFPRARAGEQEAYSTLLDERMNLVEERGAFPDLIHDDDAILDPPSGDLAPQEAWIGQAPEVEPAVEELPRKGGKGAEFFVYLGGLARLARSEQEQRTFRQQAPQIERSLDVLGPNLASSPTMMA